MLTLQHTIRILICSHSNRKSPRFSRILFFTSLFTKIKAQLLTLASENNSDSLEVYQKYAIKKSEFPHICKKRKNKLKFIFMP